jgi:hypothetical protein
MCGYGRGQAKGPVFDGGGKAYSFKLLAFSQNDKEFSAAPRFV